MPDAASAAQPTSPAASTPDAGSNAPAAAPAPTAAAAPAAPAGNPPVDPKAAFEKAWTDYKGNEATKAIAEFAKASGFPPGTVAILAAREKAQAEAAEAEFKHLSEKGWLEELQQDKVLGGEKTRETMVDVMRAHDKLSPELQKLIKDEGVLYNPVVVRILHDIGTKLREDTFVRPGASPGQSQQLSADERLSRMFAPK